MWSRSHGFPLLRHSTPWKQAKQTQCNHATPDRNTTLDFYCWGLPQQNKYNKMMQIHNWNTMVGFHCCSMQLPKTKPNNYNNYETIHNENNSHEFPQPRHLIAQNRAKQYQSMQHLMGILQCNYAFPLLKQSIPWSRYRLYWNPWREYCQKCMW